MILYAKAEVAKARIEKAAVTRIVARDYRRMENMGWL